MSGVRSWRCLLIGATAAMVLDAYTLSAAPGAMSISPAVMTLQGAPGQSTTQQLRLTNGSSSALTFQLVASDIVLRNGRRTFVTAGELPGSIAETAIFVPDRVVIEPTPGMVIITGIRRGEGQIAVVAGESVLMFEVVVHAPDRDFAESAPRNEVAVSRRSPAFAKPVLAAMPAAPGAVVWISIGAFREKTNAFLDHTLDLTIPDSFTGSIGNSILLTAIAN